MADLDPSASALKMCRLPAYGVHDGARILVCSDELAEMFGAASAAEVVGRELFSFIAPEARDQAIATIVSGASGDYASIGVRLDGAQFPIQILTTSIRSRDGEARLMLVRDLSPVALIVDDEAPVARMTASLLRLAGYQSVAYTSPRQALADYQAGAASLIVSDIQMPELDGIAMVQELRKIEPGVPVLYISGYSVDPPPQDATTFFLSKPFGMQDLAQALAGLPEPARAPLE